MSGKTWESLWRDRGQGDPWTIPDRNVVALAPKLKEAGVRRGLDLGCGLGRHVCLLASEGIEVHGLDASPSAVAFCREWLARDRLDATVSTGEERPRPCQKMKTVIFSVSN